MCGEKQNDISKAEALRDIPEVDIQKISAPVISLLEQGASS
jgi:hypothetical protein